jgi:hypothetical protein
MGNYFFKEEREDTPNTDKQDINKDNDVHITFDKTSFNYFHYNDYKYINKYVIYRNKKGYLELAL